MSNHRGWLSRTAFSPRIALLAGTALIAAAAPAASQTVTVSALEQTGAFGRAGVSHNRTVVGNPYGFFATYVYEGNEAASHTRWRLVRSTNGGTSFQTPAIYENCPAPQPLETCAGGPAPVIETDRDGNIYLIYSDANTQSAYLMRFLVADNYAVPSSVLELPGGAAQKFSAVIDETRGQLYYVAHNFLVTLPSATTGTIWLFRIPLNGTTYSRQRLTIPGVTYFVEGTNFGPYPVEVQYPHLYLDEHDHLYAAWTTTYCDPNPPPISPPCRSWNYYSIHFMRSRDGATTWERLDGTSITLPVIAGGPGSEAHEVTDVPNQGAFLWNIIVKQGKVHFFYRENSPDHRPMQYVRYDVVSGLREHVTSNLGGLQYQLNAEHGSCATRRERLDATIYCVATTTDGDNDPKNDTNDRVAVLRTVDNGETWQDYAATDPDTDPYSNCNECQYGINAARQITEGGHLIGTFTDKPVTHPSPTTLRFYSVPVLDMPPHMVFTGATVTASNWAPGLTPELAGDENPVSHWLSSSPNNAEITLDLGSVKEVRWLKWTSPSVNAPAHFVITASDDYLNWRIIRSRTLGYPLVNGYENIYANARYLRLTSSKVNDGTGWPLGFYEFWAEGAEPPGARLPTNWVDMSSAPPGFPGGYAVDNDINTAWVAATTVQPSNNNAWIAIDLGSIRPITRLRWLGANWTPHSAHSPANYWISVSNDLTNWRVINSRTNVGGVISGEELIAATARYIVLNVTKVNGGSGQPLGFREFWAEGPPVP
jgi:hypothetical protein